MRVAIVSVLLPLALATSASAEGAWVLWKRWSIYFDNGSGTGNEEVVAAYPTYVECQQWLRIQVHGAAIDTLPSNSIIARSTAEAHGDSVTQKTYHWDGRSNVAISSWRCLPDTVDPRGPKGK